MTQPKPRWILHLCTPQAWEEAKRLGTFRAQSLDSQGFIHLSTPDQILAVANNLYRGLAKSVLLWVDPARLQSELRWEPVGDAIFPHLYGALNLDAVSAVTDFIPAENGYFYDLPKVNL
jgi:uncharacterized protein (DUF952 family)